MDGENNKIQNQFEFRPNGILVSTKEYFWKRELDLLKKSEIRSKHYNLSKKEELFSDNLKIIQSPNKGYMDKFKFACKKCQYVDQWIFKHIQLQDVALYDKNQNFEEVDGYLPTGSQILFLLKDLYFNEEFYEILNNNSKDGHKMKIEQ